MEERLQFVINDEVVEEVINPAMTVLDYLRYSKGLVGTKIGCREGDCGACTVLLGEISYQSRIQYRSITSCLTPMANVHHRHVVTIEGLSSGMLSPVQQAMVDQLGTQCGICTPGFVISMTGFVLNSDLSKECLIDAVDGNICRCTGYKSIERAASVVQSALLELGDNHQLDTLVEQQFVPAYFKTIPKILLQYWAHSFSLDHSNSIVGGGTDLYVHQSDDLLSRQVTFIKKQIDIAPVNVVNEWIIVEKHATATDLLECEPIRTAIPQWVKFMKLISSTPIRNIGTIAGNIVNASPIGDFTTILLALDAQLIILDDLGNERIVPLNQFYMGYKKFDLKAGEYLHQIRCKLPTKNDYFHFDKVCKRQYLDISTVNTAVFLTINNQVIDHAVVSMGGVGPIPLYLERTSKYLIGKSCVIENIKTAVEILQTEIAPISDVRGSQTYKRRLASHLFVGHFAPFFSEQEIMSLV